MAARYLRVKNHDQYQHYSTRNPPWIKLYRSILGDYDLRQVSEKTRLCFIYLTVIACETENRIPEDLKYLSERFGFTVTKAVLSPLIERGLLLASSDSDLLAHDALCSSLNISSLSSSPNGIGKTERKGVKRDISDDDKPTEKHFEFGKSLGIDVGPEWGKFKNYCKAHGKQYVDFEAAFRNWLANAKQMGGPKRVVH